MRKEKVKKHSQWRFLKTKQYKKRKKKEPYKTFTFGKQITLLR